MAPDSFLWNIFFRDREDSRRENHWGRGPGKGARHSVSAATSVQLHPERARRLRWTQHRFRGVVDVSVGCSDRCCYPEGQVAALLENKQRSDRSEPLREPCPRAPAPLLPSHNGRPCGLWLCHWLLELPRTTFTASVPLARPRQLGQPARSFYREQFKTNRVSEGPMAGEGAFWSFPFCPPHLDTWPAVYTAGTRLCVTSWRKRREGQTSCNPPTASSISQFSLCSEG